MPDAPPPPPPPQPNPPYLFGATPAEVDASRRADALRLDWQPVQDATHYDIAFGGADVRHSVSPGDFLGSLQPDTAQSVTLVALNDGGASPPSAALIVATRPTRPPAPSLGVSTTARGPTSLQLAWAAAGGSMTYNVRVNGTELAGEVLPPFDLTALGAGMPLLPNREYKVAVRARDDSVGGTSEWSDETAFVTRPPTPGAPLRMAFDLFLFGLVMQWDLASGFDGQAQAFVRLWRDTEGIGKELIGDGSGLPGGWLTHRFVDVRYAPERRKRYWLEITVPRLAVPDDVLGGDNGSFPGSTIDLYRPICIRVGPWESVLRRSGEIVASLLRGGIV
jgi:hypothetical protein